MTCTHDRTISINAHSSDLNNVEVPHLGIEKDGYMPFIKGIGGGDDVSIEICLDCGTVIGFDPMSDDEVKVALGVEDEE